MQIKLKRGDGSELVFEGRMLARVMCPSIDRCLCDWEKLSLFVAASGRYVLDLASYRNGLRSASEALLFDTKDDILAYLVSVRRTMPEIAARLIRMAESIERSLLRLQSAFPGGAEAP